jgi:hypothetical protein
MGFTGGNIRGVDEKSIKALNNKLSKLERAVRGTPAVHPYETGPDRISKFFSSQDDNNNPNLPKPMLTGDIDADQVEFMDTYDDDTSDEERDITDYDTPVNVAIDETYSVFSKEYPTLVWDTPVVPMEWFEIRTEDANWGKNNINHIKKIAGTECIFEWKAYNAWCDKKAYNATDTHLTFNSDCEYNGYWAAAGGPGTCERSTDQYYQGAYSWKIVHAGLWGGAGQSFVTPSAGTVIAINARIYVSSGGPVRVGMWDATSDWWTGYATVSTTGSWQNVTIYQTVPAGAGATSYLLAQTATAGTFYFDNFSAVRCARRYITLYIKAMGKNGRYSPAADSITLYNSPPDMRGYTVGGTTVKKSRLITVNWSDWTSIDDDKIARYKVYSSTTSPADADSAVNLVANVTKKTDSFHIPGKQVKVVHDVRVVPYDLYGRGFASK